MATEQPGLEGQIAQWRTYLVRQRAVRADDVDELEDHLRTQVASLTEAGLSPDEAFLVAVKRLGDLNTLSREFAREYSERLWKQLVMTSDGDEEDGAAARTEAVVVVALALVSALAIKIPELFGRELFRDQNQGFYARNVSLFVLPLLAGYFVWKRQLAWVSLRWLVGAFVAVAVFANVYPFAPGGHTEVLTVLHVPIALGLAIGIAYAGGHWSSVAGRMNFVRFSGELFIYYSLIAFGGGVLVNTKPTASGRVTRRASSDPACCGGKRSRFPFRGRPFRARKENLSMHDWQSLAHVRWECKYHVVIIPKFRRKILYGQLRKQVGRILRALCDQRGVELLEGKAMADHVHLCLSIPPKYSVAHTVGFLKGKSAVQIHRKLLRERRMTGLHFWSTGYCVSTVGLDEGRIREYIREQEQLEAGQGDLDLK